MSTFLYERHYKLVLPGIHELEKNLSSSPSKYTITEIISIYMERTKCSFTQDDVANLQTLYLARYNHDPS